MKLGVIGEPCIDFIHRAGKNGNKQLGGVLYSVVSLAVIAGEDDLIYPVMNLGADEFDGVMSFLSAFRNIKTGFINRCSHKTRVVNLYYSSPGINASYDREETSTEPTYPVDSSVIKNALSGIDSLLVNMVSGSDITLDDYKWIGDNFGGYIHTDLHNVVMRTYQDGRRERAPAEHWQDWCSCADTLQMNEAELNMITGEEGGEYKTAEKILSLTSKRKTKALALTRGRSGATLFMKKEKEAFGEKYFELDRIDLPAVERNNFVDSTGCGDVFAAAFFYRNAAGGSFSPGSLKASMNFANRAASLNTSVRGVEELFKLNVSIA